MTGPMARPLTRALHVAFPFAGGAPMTSRRTLPVALVVSVRSPAVNVTGTRPVEVNVSVARTRWPCRLHTSDTFRTVTAPEGDEEDDDEEDDDEEDGVVVRAGIVMVAVSPGISGSRLPNGIPSEGVTKLGVGTTNASVAPAEAPVGLPA